MSLTVGIYGAGCAADAGDAFKTLSDASPIVAPGDTGVPAEVGAYSDDGPTGTDAPAAPDTWVAPGDSGSNDTGTVPPPDVATTPDVATPPPDVGVGAGCASGATVVVLTTAAGQYSANSGNFNTAGPVCVELHGSVHQGWGLSNAQGRMLTLISAAGTQGPIDASGSLSSLAVAPQAGADGFVYWNFTAGSVSYTSVYIF